MSKRQCVWCGEIADGCEFVNRFTCKVCACDGIESHQWCLECDGDGEIDTIRHHEPKPNHREEILVSEMCWVCGGDGVVERKSEQE